MPYPDQAFDLVVSMLVIHEMAHPIRLAVLDEIKRVLKPGGQLLIVGAVYKTAKFERRNRRIVREGGMTYLSVQEFVDSFYAAGFTQASVYEERRKGWFCAVGIRPK